jgi:hypothetical protein
MFFDLKRLVSIVLLVGLVIAVVLSARGAESQSDDRQPTADLSALVSPLTRP